MISKKSIEFLEKMNISPINGEFYTIEDEANAYFASIICILLMLIAFMLF